MGENLPARRPAELAAEPVAAMDADTLRAIWPWIGEVDRFVDGGTGWDIVEDPAMPDNVIAARWETATIRVRSRELLRSMMRAEADRSAAELAIIRQRVEDERRERFARAVANGYPRELEGPPCP